MNKEYEIGEDVSSAHDIAAVTMEGIPACLRVRMAMDVMQTAVTEDEWYSIETIVSKYLDEAFLVERDFDWDSAMGIEPIND